MKNTLIHYIREIVNQDLALGCDDFKNWIEDMINRTVRKGVSGRPCVIEEAGFYYVY